MKAAIYARVSTEEQTLNFSIENQLDQLRRYCQQRDYQVSGEYVDPGWSGATLNRPGLIRLLEDARARAFDTVVVYKLDRLSRSIQHMYNTLAEWEQIGVSLASVTEPFDTSTTMGKAYLGMASTFAEWERNTFMERSRDGVRKSVEKGHYSGGIVAYGYRLNPATKKLEIDEQEAEIVKGIFSWILEHGQSCITIAKRLNAMNIPTRYIKDGRGVRGKSTAGMWRPARVYNMLRNTAYKGMWEYGKRNKKRQTMKQSCPAIVGEETFALVQAKLRENNHWSDRTRRKPYILRSLIKCDICGHNYTGCTSHTTSHKELSYYRCNMRTNRGHILPDKCQSPSVRADVIEEIVWQQICEYIQNPDLVREALKDKYDVCKQAEYVSGLAQAKHRLEELKQAEQRLLVRYADPSNKVSEEALNGALNEIKGNRQVVQDKVNELENSIVSKEEESRRLNDVTEALSTLRKGIEIATPETKQKVCKSLVKEISVNRNRDGATVFNIKYIFDRDLLTGDGEFELLSARTGIHNITSWPIVTLARNGMMATLYLRKRFTSSGIAFS